MIRIFSHSDDLACGRIFYHSDEDAPTFVQGGPTDFDNQNILILFLYGENGLKFIDYTLSLPLLGSTSNYSPHSNA